MTKKNICEMFLDFVYPLIILADTDEEILQFADYAKTIWNYCIVKTDNLQSSVDYEQQFIKIRSQSIEFHEMCLFLESEKEKKFPNCHQLISNIGMEKRDNGERIFYVDTLKIEFSK